MTEVDGNELEQSSVLGVRFKPSATTAGEMVYVSGALRMLIVLVLILLLPLCACVIFLDEFVLWLTK